ncbi:MAG TPA: hypothetical protein VIQ80_02985 [Candidatus Saccharimonadales bacterium]
MQPVTVKVPMERPQREVGFYDTETDDRFREALIGLLLAPAYARAIDYNKDTGDTSDYVMLDQEAEYDDGVHASYDFYAELGGDSIVIGITEFSGVGELSPEAVSLLAGEIKDSNLPESVRAKAGNPHEIEQATIELFARHEFEIDLEASTVSQWTNLGFAINGHEIHADDEADEPISELDFDRMTMIEPRELVELIRALLAMSLVTEDEVQHFLEAF